MHQTLTCILFSAAWFLSAEAQNIKLRTFELKNPPVIGAYHGVNVRYGGISGISYIDGSRNEFYLVTDRGPNADAANANSGIETKIFPFPKFAPTILKVRAEGDSLRILETLTLKLPGGATASGIPHLAAEGETAEVAWSDTNRAPVTFDDWGIDSESLTLGDDGDFWVGDEYSPSLWRVNGKSGVLIMRYSPYRNSSHERAIDSVLTKRRPNRGFEGIACTPNGKIYAILQAPMYNPDKAAGESTRLHRILEIDPATSVTRMFAYEHEAPTANIRNKDLSVSDLAAINDHEFLVIEHASRGGENIKKIFKIDLAEATPITRESFGGKTFEQLGDAVNCIANGIAPVRKTLYMDLLANGWDATYDKPEGLAIVNDTTIVVINDNDFGVDSPNLDGIFVFTKKKTVLHGFVVPRRMALNLANGQHGHAAGN